MSEETGAVEATTPQTEPTPSADLTPESVVSQAPNSWIDSVADADTKLWAEGKGLHNGSFENVLGSYRNLEKLMGADRAGNTVTMLGDDPSPEQLNEFYTKLGRPETIDGYSFALEEGADTTRLNGLRAVAHELGITDKQFSGLAAADSSYNSNIVDRNADEIAQTAVDAQNSLKREWGAAYDHNLALTDNYASQLGVTEDQMQGLASALGVDKAVEFIYGLGDKLGDDSVDTGGIADTGVLTPSQAQEALRGLTSNKDFMEAWMNKSHIGHKDAVAKKQSLAQLSVGIAP